MRLRPRPSPASAASAAWAAMDRGDLPGASKLPPLQPAPPRVERGVGAALAAPARVERGVPIASAGLSKKFEGLMPGIERVERGLRPRVDWGSSPKKPPTISSSAPKVGVCSMGEPAANMEGVNPVPHENSRSNVPIPPTAEFGTCPELGCRLEPGPPARLRVETEPDPRALLGCRLADLLGSLSSPKCFGARPEP